MVVFSQQPCLSDGYGFVQKWGYQNLSVHVHRKNNILNNWISVVRYFQTSSQVDLTSKLCFKLICY